MTLPVRKRPAITGIDHKWEVRFYELVQFKKKFGHCNVPDTDKHKRYYTLAMWCNYQRHMYKYKPLKYSPDKIKKLNGIGFCWAVNDKRFDTNFNQLKKFKDTHGHCDVSWMHDKTLSKWCSKLRADRLLNEQRLTKQRIKRLTALGFNWDDRNEQLWDEKFALLKEYKKKYGHFHITHGNAKYACLSPWMATQRRYFQKGSEVLTARRKAKLDSIGFDWNSQVGTNKLQDEEMLVELRRLHRMAKRPPSAVFIGKHGKYPVNTYLSHFGTLGKAREAAGIVADKILTRPNVYSDEELLNDLKRIAELTGKFPSATDVDAYGKYSKNIYFIRFGSFANAKEKAGLGKKKAVEQFKKEMLDDLQRLLKKFKKRPSQFIVSKYGNYAPNTYKRYFGSFLAAVKEAGIETV